MSDDAPMEYPPPTLTLKGYPPLTDADREALARAIVLARRESEQQRNQVDRMLIDDGFGHAARFSSYCCQDSALELKPWETPICWLRNSDADLDKLLRSLPKGPDQRGYRRAALLLRRLLKNGLSRFEPDPLNAIERAEAKAKAKVKVKKDRPAPPPRPIDGPRPIEDEDLRH